MDTWKHDHLRLTFSSVRLQFNTWLVSFHQWGLTVYVKPLRWNDGWIFGWSAVRGVPRNILSSTQTQILLYFYWNHHILHNKNHWSCTDKSSKQSEVMVCIYIVVALIRGALIMCHHKIELQCGVCWVPVGWRVTMRNTIPAGRLVALLPDRPRNLSLITEKCSLTEKKISSDLSYRDYSEGVYSKLLFKNLSLALSRGMIFPERVFQSIDTLGIEVKYDINGPA